MFFMNLFLCLINDDDDDDDNGNNKCCLKNLPTFKFESSDRFSYNKFSGCKTMNESK